ncbi:aa3-type cytochrome oxidase subunit II [Schumannella soli]|uniref:cytochrome-c oxidase n=1 Tax=Schumannella soli TaxID=2590779 RepID=A0A506Y5S0_9MICO|nr:cytochrome c oxidase subunit II [Schumannella soli]TPW76368.1 cytochrome c oxidase subunit II [Schumannella soli]
MRSQRRSRLARWAILPIGVAVTAILAGCTDAQLRGFLPPAEGVTNHTDRVIGLWTTSWIVLLIVGIITWGLIIWAAVAYRRRKGQTGLPVQLRYNMPVEIFYTIVPLILVLGFFAFTARDQAEIEKKVDPDYKITVYGKRWAWDFQYDTSNTYKQSIQTQVDSKGEIIEDSIPTLYLPVDKKIEIDIKSRDVIHSFWVIEFLYKKDMIPAKTNHMYFTPLKEGVYQGKCAELCGEYHSLMLFKVAVVSQDEYDAQMKKLEDAGNTGPIGEDLNANTNLPGNGTSTTSVEG